MKSHLQNFVNINIPPNDLKSDWLESAIGSVELLAQNAKSDEIILYTNVGQAYVHAVLAPLQNVTPPDGSDLQRAYVGPDSHWALEHVSGGGQPDQMYLADPLDHPGCQSLVGGEQLVFRRYFTDVDKGPVRTELSQRLIQALDLYFLEEESAYCRLNEDGDIEPIIRVRDLSQEAGQKSAILVTIEAEQLHRYMAVTGTALIVKFDFTRYRAGAFSGWHEPNRGEFANKNLFHHSGIQSEASFVNGALIVRPLLTRDMLIAKARREWEDGGKEYATFEAYDWKNSRLAEISCAPSALASYFEKDSQLPFQVTPAFFKPEVLQKYKSDPEKYTLEHRSIRARGGWYLKSYDVNDEGQVHAYLYDLARLPYREQLYWKAFNERPKGSISKRAFETDFEGNFSSIADPLEDLKYEILKLDREKPDWWKPRGEVAASAVHYPITSSPEEWANAVLALDQFVIEGFVTKNLRHRLDAAGKTVDKKWQSIRLLQDCLVLVGLDESEAFNVVEPFKQTHWLRSKVKGHLAQSEKQTIIKKARTEHGSLASQFRALAGDVQMSFDRVVELL